MAFLPEEQHNSELGNILQTFLAYQFAFKILSVQFPAEDTARSVFLENDHPFAFENFQGILNVDAQGISNFLWYCDPTMPVDSSEDSFPDSNSNTFLQIEYNTGR